MVSNIDKDLFMSYCTSPLYSKSDIEQKFNLSPYKVEELISKLNISYRAPFGDSLKRFILAHSREEVSKYYSNHTLKKCLEYYNMTRDSFLGALKYYGINKFNSFNKLIKKYSKEDIEAIYYGQTITLTDYINQSDLSIEMFHKIREYYNIPLKGQKQLDISKNKKSLAYHRKTEEEKQAIINKISQTEKITWKNKDESSLKDISLKRSKAKIYSKPYSPIFKEIYYNIDKAKEYLKEKSYTYKELSDILMVPYNALIIWANKYDLDSYIKKEKSNYENELGELLTSWGLSFIRNARSIIPPQELDFYIPDKKIAIEFNGIFWHSTQKISDNNYHFNKSKRCEELGIRLIHIYEYEWSNLLTKQKIKSMLRITLNNTQTKIYARDCLVKIISNKEAKPFNNENHLQNHRDAQVTYGLFYRDELVQLMSFNKAKYNKNLDSDNSWEIIRGCPGSNDIVVGGVGKLFKYFIKDYKPDKVFSYCDFNKFDGRGYLALGMKFIGYTGPDMKWVMKDMSVASRKPSKHQELKNKSIAQIFGAGSKKYLWENPLKTNNNT